MKHFIFIISILPFFCSYGQNWQRLDSLCYDYGDIKPDSAILLGKKAIEGCITEKGNKSKEYATRLDHSINLHNKKQ